jgi:GTP-sensing pleiotropic transcriptional regulator CodY
MNTFEEFSEEKITSRKFTDNYDELVDFIEQMRQNAPVDYYAINYPKNKGRKFLSRFYRYF